MKCDKLWGLCVCVWGGGCRGGQKDLLRDVIKARCARHPLIGRPHKVRLAGGCKGVHAT